MKKKSIILTSTIIVLAMILCSLLFFIYTIHAPYTSYHSSIEAIKEEIIEEEHINYVKYFNAYNGEDTYYVIMNHRYCYVFSSSQRKIYKELLNNLKIDDVSNAVDQSNYSKIHYEYGYENNTICGVYRLETDTTVEYRYYNLETGQLMKDYRMKK